MNRREFGQEAFNNEQFLAGGLTLLLSGLIGVVGNIFVLIITYRILRYRKNVPTILILFLAWTDLLTFPLIYPQSLIKYFYGSYVGNYIACDYQGTVITFLFAVSICLILVMSIDRLLALYKPFCYEKYISYDKEKVKVAGIGLGAAGLTIALLPALGVGRNVLHFPGTFCLFEWGAESIDGKALVYLYMAFLMLTMLAIIVCNLTVVVLTWRLLRKMTSDNTPGNKESSQQHADTNKLQKEATKQLKESTKPRKAANLEANKVYRSSGHSGKMEKQFAKLSGVAAISFVGCWGLFLVRITMIQAGYPFDAFTDFTAVRVASLHSVVNPWFYPLLRRKYREGFWYLMIWTGHVVTCTYITKPNTTLDDIVGGTPRLKRSKKVIQQEDRRRSSSRFLSTSTLTTDSKDSKQVTGQK